MSLSLPPHVARKAEPIPAPSARANSAPDMRAAIPIETMLAQLARVADDDVAFVEQFRAYIQSIGCTLLAHYDREGDVFINLGTPADPQIRHRNRWTHFLFDRLDAVPGRRETLLRALAAEREVWDERPTRPAETTAAIRGFLRTGGRILINPEGRLEEGAGIPRRWIDGTDAERAEIERASQTYHSVRRRWRADRQIKRAVRMLGSSTSNGWTVLEAQA